MGAVPVIVLTWMGDFIGLVDYTQASVKLIVEVDDWSTFAAVVVVEQTLGSWAELGWKRWGRKGGQIGIVKYWMDGWAGLQDAGWVDWVVVISVCETSGRSVLRFTSPIFAEFWGDLLLVFQVVLFLGTGNGFWAVMHNVFGYLFSNSAFLQMVSAAPYFVLHHILCCQCLRCGWWPLLGQTIICSFLDNFESSVRSSFSPFMPYIRKNFSWETSPYGSTPDGGFHSRSGVRRLLD